MFSNRIFVGEPPMNHHGRSVMSERTTSSGLSNLTASNETFSCNENALSGSLLEKSTESRNVQPKIVDEANTTPSNRAGPPNCAARKVTGPLNRDSTKFAVVANSQTLKSASPSNVVLAPK